ncbi:hypothetical protein NADFUDRAFT_51578 [Nadsonia fulvescens var. elongata DSM 6958]|uniref:Uncharacterized protein n=1 Tax=Nadsonia fulvescens var. elongata DSM 6958 TaxID=857566 RepID=A0A1E3PI58_9ASCO|nr:hypothetical protein NADFUDRAFT_51578 [Nadsonia fulvescens var. elongata DSM 6958]
MLEFSENRFEKEMSKPIIDHEPKPITKREYNSNNHKSKPIISHQPKSMTNHEKKTAQHKYERNIIERSGYAKYFMIAIAFVAVFILLISNWLKYENSGSYHRSSEKLT